MLTTSYPRSPEDVAGNFVAGAVEHARAAGVDVDVVSPASFRDFGVAYGGGIVQNLRAKPWLAGALPAFVGAYARAARVAARGADLVHAHWIPSGIAALATGKPFVLQVWGTDVELARRAPRLARAIVRRAELVITASAFLTHEAIALGAREVRVIPTGVEIPDEPGEPEEPPHVLYAGRLSPEKGILEFVAATEGLPRVVAGDGPLRPRVPDALGFVAPAELGAYYRRAALVCVPSRREGYGMTAREGMAWGRPVVASSVGGLLDIAGPGVVSTPPGDADALREALSSLLADADRRRALGAEARRRAIATFSWESSTEALLAAYADALR